MAILPSPCSLVLRCRRRGGNRFPASVQTLKIDQSFIGRLTESATNAKVVQSIIALGKAMELSVVAEGVETEQQLMLVQAFGCDLAQGFFIGKPMPEIDFLDWCHAVDQTTNDLQVLPKLARQKA